MQTIKIPGLSKEDIWAICDKVAMNHKQKAFGPYTEDDITQTAWVIILEKISEYDSSRSTQKDPRKGLEHWLNTVVSRRLSNFYRDKYLVPQRAFKADSTGFHQRKRMNLMHPLDVDDISDHNIELKPENIEDKEYFDFILEHLSEDFVDILDSILSGESVNGYYRNKLSKAIEKIRIEEWLPKVEQQYPPKNIGQ